jgi:hypothetical protein
MQRIIGEHRSLRIAPWSLDRLRPEEEPDRMAVKLRVARWNAGRESGCDLVAGRRFVAVATGVTRSSEPTCHCATVGLRGSGSRCVNCPLATVLRSVMHRIGAADSAVR